jgi:outer membrane receptor protein involved in Fe transport
MLKHSVPPEFGQSLTKTDWSVSFMPTEVLFKGGAMRCRKLVMTCLAGTMLSGGAALAQEAAPPPARELEEIVVTATKRPEPVREISGSVSAYDEVGLEIFGAQGFEDYLTRTPGVVFNASIPGNSAAIVRGVATTTGIAQAQGTTGYFINEIPLTDPFYSTGIPDIDTFDVGNIAVMRGPQGTLFGSASMGGAVNYQAAKPDLGGFDVHLRGSLERNADDEDGYTGNVMFNVPVVDGVFALRGVYGQRKVAGFVDNAGTGESNSNETTIEGGRFLASFVPTEGTEINYVFLDQETSTDDIGSAEPLLGDYEKSTLIAEPFEYGTQLHNLRLDQDVGFGTLTVTATHSKKDFTSQQDFSGLAPPLAPVAFLEPGSSEGETYEIRLASSSNQRFEYLVGLFYNDTDEDVQNILDAPAAVPVFGTSELLVADVQVQGREQAAFGEGTWHFNDQWKVTVGGRLFSTELDVTTIQSGPLVGGTITTGGDSKEDDFSPKASLTWQPSDQQLYYLLASRGFRFGGPNIAVDPAFEIPSQFDSDSLWNYELGARLNFLDDRLLVDGTLYMIDWSDIQVTQTSPNGFTYTDNAGKARNQGFELSASFRVNPSLRLQAAATYLDGQLERDFESAGGIVPAGSTLPGASEWQVSDAIVYTPQMSAFAPEFVLSHRYISSAPAVLVPGSPEQGGYNLFDLRIGGRKGPLGVYLFVDNVSDERGVSRADVGVRGPVEFLVQPRTIGITLDYRR